MSGALFGSIQAVAKAALLKLPRQRQARIIEASDALAAQLLPPGVLKMHGDENLCRIRSDPTGSSMKSTMTALIVLVVRRGGSEDVIPLNS